MIVKDIRALPAVFFQAEFPILSNPIYFFLVPRMNYTHPDVDLFLNVSTLRQPIFTPFYHLLSTGVFQIMPATLDAASTCNDTLARLSFQSSPQPSRIITRIDHIRKHSRQNQNHKGYSQIRPYTETTERYRSSEIGRETAWCWFLDSLYLGERK